MQKIRNWADKHVILFWLAICAAVIGTATIVTACSSTSKAAQPYLDAPQMANSDTTPMLTIAMSDGFSNVGAKCHNHDGIYVVYHGDSTYGSVMVVPNDPNCATGVYR